MTTADRRRRAVAAGQFVDVLLGVSSLVPAALLYHGFFGSWSYMPAFALTVVGATTTAVAGVVFGWSRLARVAVACLALITLEMSTALSSTLRGMVPTADTATELVLGVVSGWAKMLSVGVPAAASGQVLVFFILFHWIAAQAVVAVVVGSRSAAAPVVPVVIAYGVGLVVVATPIGTHMSLTAFLVMLSLALIIVRARRVTVQAVRATSSPTGTPARRRLNPVVGGVVLTVVPLAVGIAVTDTGVFGDGAHRADPRPLQPNAELVPDMLTPLVSVKPQLRENPPKLVLTATFPADAPTPPGIAVAALDRFDGYTWTTDDRFLTAGQRLASDRAQESRRTVSAHVTITDLPSQFVPVVGWPSQLTFTASAPAAVGFSASSGSLITAKPLTSGTTYDVLGQLNTPTELPGTAQPTIAPGDDPYRWLPPGIPTYLDTLTHQVADSAINAAGKLSAINTFLRGLPYNLDAPPGHSYADVTRVVASTQTREDGYAEQHAAAFAVMARELGYQARVVVGYRLHDPNNGTFTVTSRDATAWAEVHFDKYGWVAYDPTDIHQTKRNPLSEVTATPIPIHVPADVAPAPNRNTVITLPTSVPPSVDLRLVALDIALVLICLSGLWFLSILIRKAARRSRRRRAPSSAAQVVGAWEESVDRLAELGLSVTLSMTPLEFSRHANDSFGERTATLVLLAEPATTAVFGPEHISADDVIQAWQLERRLRRDLYPGWRRLLRLRTWLSPRPFAIRKKMAGQRRRRRS